MKRKCLGFSDRIPVVFLPPTKLMCITCAINWILTDLLPCLKIRASVRAYIGLLRCFKELLQVNLCMAAAVRERFENYAGL